MNKGFFADALASRPLLWEAVLRANSFRASSPTPLSCATEAAALFGEAAAPFLAWLAERPATVRCGHKEQDGTFWDYVEESRRLALLNTETLSALSLVAGVALHAPDIARVLRREEVQALRSGIGENMYRYALCRGQYQLGGVRRSFARLHPSLPLTERCALHGSMAPRLVATRWPDELAKRFLSKLPPLPEGTQMPALDEVEVRNLWLALKKLLLKEVAPSWAPCFE